MKKIIYLSVGIIMLFCILCSCTVQKDNSKTESTYNSSDNIEKISGSSEKSKTDAGNDPFSEKLMTPSRYDTIEKFLNSIETNFSGEKLAEIEQEEADGLKGTFRNFIEEIKKEGLYVPYYQGKEIQIEDKEGFNNISLFPAGSYSQPCVWYYPKTDLSSEGIPLISGISIMYLDNLLNSKEITEANEKGAFWLMKRINPNGQGENVKPYPPFDEISEKEIVLKDRTVKAQICLSNNTPRINVFFVYEEILITVTIMPEISYDWFKELSFVKMPLKG